MREIELVIATEGRRARENYHMILREEGNDGRVLLLHFESTADALY